jgi:hypothetical protein
MFNEPYICKHAVAAIILMDRNLKPKPYIPFKAAGKMHTFRDIALNALGVRA